MGLERTTRPRNHGPDHLYGHPDWTPGIITEITSSDTSITVTRSPSDGPAVDLTAGVYTPPTTNEELFATPTVAAISGSTPGSTTCSWSHTAFGTVFSLSTATEPRIITAGHYAFNIQINCDDTISTDVKLDFTLFIQNASLANEFVPERTLTWHPAETARLRYPMAATWYMGVNYAFALEIANWDTASHDFACLASVQRLT